jgi:hypothetical protein
MESNSYNGRNCNSLLNGSLKGGDFQIKNGRQKSCSMLNLKTINLEQQNKGKKKVIFKQISN